MHSLQLPGFDPLDFLLKLRSTERSVSVVRHDEWTVIAWNPRRSIVGRRVEDWEKLQNEWEDRNQKPTTKNLKLAIPFTGGGIGYVSYDFGRKLLHVQRGKHKLNGAGFLPASRDPQQPLFAFHFYDRAIVHHAKTGTVHVVGDRTFAQIIERIHARIARSATIDPIQFTPDITKAQYRSAFRKVMHAITIGDVYQLNLTYRFHARSGCDRRALFVKLMRANPAPHASYLETPGCTLLSLSPERFISIDGDRIVTTPIKGTRPRGNNRADDQRMKRELLSDEKEQAELAMITDLLRNDLGQVSVVGSVKVTKRRTLQRNATVWHTYAQIESRLDPRFTALDALQSMLPGGSVTGCPKKRAMEYIDVLEQTRRGPYCGAIAMLSSNGRVDSSIIIRTLIAQGEDLYLHVGGGIVADSMCEREWDETLAKAKNFLELATTERSVRESSRSAAEVHKPPHHDRRHSPASSFGGVHPEQRRTPDDSLRDDRDDGTVALRRSALGRKIFLSESGSSIRGRATSPNDALIMVNGTVTRHVSDDHRALLDPSRSDTFGVFETMRTKGKILEDLDAHLHRLERSAAILGFPLPRSLRTIRADAARAVAECGRGPARVKIIADRKDVIVQCTPLGEKSRSGIVASPQSIRKFLRSMSADRMSAPLQHTQRDRTPAPVKHPSTADAVIIAAERKNPQAKALPYKICFDAHQAALDADCIDALLVNRRKEISEGAYTNLFWMKDGTLFTPDNNILHGIMRQRVIAVARASGVPIRYRTPTLAVLRRADSVFLTNAIIGCVRIRNIRRE